MPIDYNNRRFRSVVNSASGEVGGETEFLYRQRDSVVWATYEGGRIRFGTLIALVYENDVLDMRYQHVNDAGMLMTGVCRSTPEVLADGRIRLHETWEWTSGDRSSGQSIVEEQR